MFTRIASIGRTSDVMPLSHAHGIGMTDEIKGDTSNFYSSITHRYHNRSIMDWNSAGTYAFLKRSYDGLKRRVERTDKCIKIGK